MTSSDRLANAKKASQFLFFYIVLGIVLSLALQLIGTRHIHLHTVWTVVTDDLLMGLVVVCILYLTERLLLTILINSVFVLGVGLLTISINRDIPVAALLLTQVRAIILIIIANLSLRYFTKESYRFG